MQQRTIFPLRQVLGFTTGTLLSGLPLQAAPPSEEQVTQQLYRDNPYVIPAPPAEAFDESQDPFLNQVGKATLRAYEVTDPQVLELSRRLLSQSGDQAPEVPIPNPHPDAQWFPQAGLGLFMHWGIHSVVGAQPSWAMIKNYPYAGDVKLYPPARYFSLADHFDPQHWEPDKFLAAAADAGFEYAVLTVKHHDGYALWPSKFGDFSTAEYLPGRDLVRDFVDGCRKNGLKVGLYFSPRDWHYPGYPVRPGHFDQRHRRIDYAVPAEENQRRFEQFHAFTLGQLQELLTNYGQIDVLWFDGQSWQGIDDMRTRAVYQWIRSLQPGIVVNDRWSKVRNPDAEDDRQDFGDFYTVENRDIDDAPDSWWETCLIWDTRGGWGYDVTEQLRPVNWALQRLIANRARGGNLLLNLGPRPTGEMTEGFYQRLPELKQWMTNHRESVIGTRAAEDPSIANAPITVGANALYLFVSPGRTDPIDLTVDQPIASATLLSSGEALTPEHVGKTYRFKLNAAPDQWTAIRVVLADPTRE